MTPPFKPIVESDESTSNFDPEFTSADITHIALVSQLNLDDDDPSEDWVSQSVSNAPQYTPHGPLGSDRPPATPGIQIQQKKRGQDGASSPPLTNSVQENFRGFTYSGESESLIARVVTRLTEKEKEEKSRESAVAEEEVTFLTTDDEALDASRHAGRYSKRHGDGYLSDFDDI